MTAAGVYASRFGRVLLADPTRVPEVFTAARARGEAPAAAPVVGWTTSLAALCSTVAVLPWALSAAYGPLRAPVAA